MLTFILRPFFLPLTRQDDYDRNMGSRILWLLLALGTTIATTVAGIYLFGHITELQETIGQPTPWTQLANEATVRHWSAITFLLEIAGVVLWFVFAHMWSKSPRAPRRGVRYAIAGIMGFLGPCILLVIFALL